MAQHQQLQSAEHWHGSRQPSFNEALCWVQIVYARCHGKTRGAKLKRSAAAGGRPLPVFCSLFLQTLSRKGGCKHVNTPAHTAITSTQQKAFCIRGREQRDAETGRRRKGKKKKKVRPNRERREAAQNTEREETEGMCSETCSSMLTACDSVQVWEQDTAGESVCVCVCVCVCLNDCVSVILMGVCVCVCVLAPQPLSLCMCEQSCLNSFFFFCRITQTVNEAWSSCYFWLRRQYVTKPTGLAAAAAITIASAWRIIPVLFCLILTGTVVLAGRLQQGRIGFHVWCCLLVTLSTTTTTTTAAQMGGNIMCHVKAGKVTRWKRQDASTEGDDAYRVMRHGWTQKREKIEADVW